MIKECLISGYIILQEDLETTYLIRISERLYIALGADWRVITGTGLINTGKEVCETWNHSKA